MKKLMIICGLLLGAATFAQAQLKEKAENKVKDLKDESPEAKVKELDKELKLRKDQKIKLVKIFSDYDKTQKEIMEKAKTEDIVIIARKRIKNRDDLDTKINSVLDKNQRVAYLLMLGKQSEEMKKKWNEHIH
ncbi:hypothetical protein [Pedobacter nanyangensis]|uniref:hypothetical protein n=1 Tax=Pedobacter nanyangensis TaxID=1562389 RepID=UPI000DE29BC4|nr:hypothetical protein [Pedobacter nanyangensis]